MIETIKAMDLLKEFTDLELINEIVKRGYELKTFKQKDENEKKYRYTIEPIIKEDEYRTKFAIGDTYWLIKRACWEHGSDYWIIYDEYVVLDIIIHESKEGIEEYYLNKHHNWDEHHYAEHCFRTKEEAEAECKKRNALYSVREYEDPEVTE